MVNDIFIKDRDLEIVEEYLFNIASYERLSGSEDEDKALAYIVKELKKENIPYKLTYKDAILSNPLSASLSFIYNGEVNSIMAKTRSFSASTGDENLKGELVYISQKNLLEKPLELELEKQGHKQDLLGKIVISESGNPISILSLQNRGALGYIQYWTGDEELIHEGAVNPVWGIPRLNELDYYTKIPVICINNIDGIDLLKKLESNSISVSINTKLEKKLSKIPTLEAFIMPSYNKNEEYLLLGSHLDCWHLGATDNATGNAVGLYIAKKFNEIKEELNFGLKVAWWSGHSNGRYAGSSLYARDNYKDLLQSCLAYMNIDMPGLRGASDYTHISSGIEIFDLAQECVEKITKQKGTYSGPVRGWDQSFQNIGITPYFIWSSVLPNGHIDTTGNSSMPWWWHTEEDTVKYYDKNVLFKDIKLYTLAIESLLKSDMKIFNIDRLLGMVLKMLINLNDKYKEDIDLSKSIKEFNNLKIKIDEGFNEELSNKEILYIIKKINQIYYTAEEPYRQDFALEQGEIPGFDNLRFLKEYRGNQYYFNIILNELLAQQNRIISICNEITILLESKL